MKINKVDFRCWLVKHNMSASEFARRIGVSRSYVSYVVNGKRNITDSIVKLFEKGGYEIK